MNTERWRRLQHLLDDALDRPRAHRVSYLHSACGDDAQLLDDVLSLLHAADRASAPSSMFSLTAADFARQLLRELDGLEAQHRDRERARAHEVVRRTLAGRYELVRELGRGGMAVVYRADDLRHERTVAVKVLDGAAHADAQRFLHEIRTTARLTHPHLLPIHDSGECEGVLYYIMPYVSGETLRARLQRDGPLPLDDALRLLREIADALAHAHAEGVVHRDLKPENILLSGGHAVVADFGIATALEAAERTSDGPPPVAAVFGTQARGTPAYMAPEQLHGVVDHRTDLFALGIIAYEMLTGSHPFGVAGTSPIPALRGDVATHSLRALRPDVSAETDRLVTDLLAHDPAERVPDARSVVRRLDATGRASADARGARSWLGAAAVAGLAIAVFAAAFVSNERGPNAAAVATSVTVAVLPFEFRGADADDAYLGDGLADELAITLARLPGVRVAGRISSRSLRVGDASAREIGRLLGVDMIITGTLQRSNGRLRVTAQLISTTNGSIMGQHVHESAGADMFTLQDDVTTSLAVSLSRQIGQADTGRRLASARGTADQEAYDLYLQGRYLLMERGAENVKSAVQSFEQAIEKDPRFARAYAGLANAHTILPSYLALDPDSVTALITDNALRAVALDSTFADGRIALGTVYGRRLNLTEAERQFRAALAAEPSNVTAHHWLGIELLNLGRTEEAVALLRRGVQIDPLAKSLGAAHAGALAAARRYDEAIAEAQRVLAIDSTFPIAMLVLAHSYIFSGRPREAVLVLERTEAYHPDVPATPGLLMVAYAAAGRWHDFDALVASPRSKGGRAGRTNGIIADMVRGNTDPAIKLLTTREGLLDWFDVRTWGGCNELLDPLWDDARFRSAMVELDVQPCTLARPWSIGRREGPDGPRH